MIFGAKVRNGESLTLNFTSEFIRNDNGALTCSLVSGSTENNKACIFNTVDTSSNILSSIFLTDFCSISTCDSTSTYTLRIKNAVNKFTVKPFLGSLLISTNDTSGN
jgi:hypothetical protein